MKTQDEIYKLLDAFGNKFGYPIVDAQQRSEAWYRLKLGVISASNASRAVAKKDSDTRLTYLCELVSEVATGVPDEFDTKQMEWGRDHEGAARSSYEFAKNCEIKQIPFAFKDDSFRAGCSPDGIVTVSKGAEIKAPWDSTNFIKFLVSDKMKPEWVWQNQFTIWVMGADEWDHVMYDPRMKNTNIVVRTIKKDPEKQKVLDEAIPELIHDMDKMLAVVGLKFGDHWLRLAEEMARTKAKGA